MRKKFTMLLASMFLCMGMMAQVYQKIPHAKWTVTALNETPRQNNREGGVEFIKDEDSATFYHSDWKTNYDGSNISKGKAGLQAFMIQMGESFTFDKITYAGRSDDNTSGWATKVRIYVYETLPATWPKDAESNTKPLSDLTYNEKEDLLKRTENTVLGNPAFDNNDNPWADDRTVKTAEFATPQTGKYILFVMDGGHDSWLTCSDFHIWQKVEGIEQDKAYYLKIKDLDDYYLDIKVGESSDYGNTISKTTEPVCAYFTLNDGYWHISSSSGHAGDFVGVANWDAKPGQATPANWTIHKDDTYSCWYLAQSSYYGNEESLKHYLGANNGAISTQTKLYTDKTIAQAVKIVLEEAPVTQIVFNYYDGETKVNTVRKDFLIDTQIAIGDVPTFDFYTDYTFKTTGDIVASQGASYDISCSADFPFEIATIDGDGNIVGSWYKMTQGAGNIAYSYDNNRVNYVDDANVDAKAYWAFVRVNGESNRFNIYNLGRPGNPMTAVANQSYAQYNQSTVHISGQATGLTDFMISANNDGYNIQIPAEEISGNSATAGNHVSGFGFWSTSGTGPITEDASRITFAKVEVAELDLAKSAAKVAWKDVAWGSGFPNFTTTFGGIEISSLQPFDAAIDAAASIDEVNSVAATLEANATKYYIRMYNAGRAAERTENWYVSGNKVVKDGNASSLFLYDMNRNLQQVTTGNYLVHSTALKNQNYTYSLTNTKEDASVFTFTASTRVADSWSVYDGFGYMCDWGHTNNVFSLDTKDDNWATWAVEFEESLQAGFYTIAAGEKYVSDDRKSDSETQRVLTTETPDAKNIFYYDGQALIGYASGYGFEYACCNTQTVGAMNHFMFIDNGDGYYVKSSAGTSINGWADGFWKANDDNYLERESVADATVWTIAEVATLPVAISAAGYATLYAPVALQVPAEGVTAHTVTIEGDKAILSEALEVIPAETGVILVGTEGTHNFTVTTTNETATSALAGTFAKTYVTDDAYVLAKKNDVVGLYKATKNQQEETAFLNNAFKAYLPAPVGSEAPMFSFGRGEGTTAIDQLINTDSELVIYDLAGRRVQKMEKGIYIVNGKKVIR